MLHDSGKKGRCALSQKWHQRNLREHHDNLQHDEEKA